jgi:RHS repeat-associated protein
MDGGAFRIACETQYLIDPTGIGNVVSTFDSSGDVTTYTQGLGLTSQLSAAETAYYNFDLTGNTTELTGTNGSVLNSYGYLPFGEILKTTGTKTNPFTFVGQVGVMSDGSGQYFMRNRWDDSTTGRLTQPDPIGQAAGINLYQYVFN